ncbi:HEAT repeat domain-containing protein [Halomarina pelagica]|uniref:HEAT repeat domain-containing protein n=1 Tax=Halomarina pelagica TaxID=2961599 RepID=UPI0020C56FE7|nr:HEAT repeat domain-containing protein [Halomarina sp. BND7]
MPTPDEDDPRRDADARPPDSVRTAIEAGDWDAVASLIDGPDAEPLETRRERVRALKPVVEGRSDLHEHLAPLLRPLLDDEDRSIRLTATKHLVDVAAATPRAVAPVAPALTERLRDDFYFVRARSAEALGLLARRRPDAIDSTTVLARLVVGLSFDEPEVERKMAKALADVAIGEPRALRYLVSDLVDHLDAEDDLVRYHLVTALAAVATAHPGDVRAATAALTARLDDEVPFVRGRAAEALGLIAGPRPDSIAPAADRLAARSDDEDAFVAERARFARNRVEDDPDANGDRGGIGTLRGIADGTESIAEEIANPSPDDGRACPRCGEGVDARPPFCPACGVPFPPG